MRRFDANVAAVAHLALVVAVQLAAQKGRDVVGLHRVDGAAGEILIDGAELRLAAQDDVAGVLGLVDAAVVVLLEGAGDGTKAPREWVQPFVNLLDLPAISEALGSSPILDLHKGVVEQAVTDVASAQLRRQPVVAVAIDLQAAGQPGGNPHLAHVCTFGPILTPPLAVSD